MKREALRHPKMLDLASRLGTTRAHCIGMITLLLDWCADVTPQGNIGRWNNGAIAMACEWTADADAFIEALVASGWVDRCEVHRLLVHDLEEHAQQWWKRKMAKLGLAFLRPVRRATITTCDPPIDIAIEGSVEPSVERSTERSPSRDRTSSLQTSGEPPTPLADELIAVWNSTAGVRRVAKLTKKRQRALKVRLGEPDWPWREALGKFPLKSFASEPDGWQPTIDWFIRPDTVTSILEGKYDWVKSGNPPEETKCAALTTEEMEALP